MGWLDWLFAVASPAQLCLTPLGDTVLGSLHLLQTTALSEQAQGARPGLLFLCITELLLPWLLNENYQGLPNFLHDSAPVDRTRLSMQI